MKQSQAKNEMGIKYPGYFWYNELNIMCRVRNETPPPPRGMKNMWEIVKISP
jgi:hypothetical protein